MNQVKDGGPAFPQDAMSISRKDGRLYEAHGMTLRDYFAAKAMAAIWSKLAPDSVRSISVTQTATDAYRLADAMIQAREAK